MEDKSTLQLKLDEIDATIEMHQKKIDLGKDLEALHEDERFQRVILDAYLDDEAKRLFGVLVEPSTLKRDVMENIIDKTSSIRNLKQFFAVMLQNAALAPEQMEEERAFRKEVTTYHSENPDADTEE